MAVSRMLRGLALAVLGFLFIYPLALLLVLPVLDGWHGISDWTPLANSAGFALLTGIIAALAGYLLAQALETVSGKMVRLLDLGLWLLFLTPGYVLTTGWLVILADPEVRNSGFGQYFLGRPGLEFLYTLKALPFAVFVTRATFARTGASLIEAAMVLGLAPWRRHLLRLRLALPAMAAAFTIAAIETMQEFGIPATLGVTAKIPILTYEILPAAQYHADGFFRRRRLVLVADRQRRPAGAAAGRNPAALPGGAGARPGARRRPHPSPSLQPGLCLPARPPFALGSWPGSAFAGACRGRVRR